MIASVCPNPSVDTLIWVSSFEPGQVHRVQREQRFPGGKGVHVAMAVAALESPSTLYGIWGGATGQWIRESCSAMGVSCKGVETEDWNRTCLTFKSETALDDTELLGCGPVVGADVVATFTSEILDCTTSGDAITLSGSWPTGVPDDAYAQLIMRINERGARAFLDCTGNQLTHALAQKPYCVHLNLSEAQAALGTRDPLLSVRALSGHCTLAIVTNGADGAWFGFEGRVVRAQLNVDVSCSAVGSGDCLMAGVTVSSDRGDTFETLVRRGAACGAANCLRPELGMLNKADVDHLFAKCEVEELS
ncbi:MAG: tagatose 6-phosphate kinase [Candidatus Promineifilaceae bacterium]|jgi:tagatose 6-phosphate kinase